jgi:gentisate 1,2-dioxygenase
LQIAPTIRVAISIYRPGDNAAQHLHTPNASRTILSRQGGFTIVDGERCDAHRGDLILTPHGTWHGHGNDSAEPVIWMDVLDWPLIEYLDCIWSRSDLPAASNAAPPPPSQSLYGTGGLVPRFARAPRGQSVLTSPMIHFRGDDVRARLDALRRAEASPYEGVAVDFADPATGGPLFPTLAYRAQLLRPGEATLPYRDTASTVFVVLEGSGATDVNGQTLAWEKNDVFVVPPHMWRTHENADEAKDAVLYAVTDAPLLEKIGQFRAQGRDAAGRLIDLALQG